MYSGIFGGMRHDIQVHGVEVFILGLRVNSLAFGATSVGSSCRDYGTGFGIRGSQSSA